MREVLGVSWTDAQPVYKGVLVDLAALIGDVDYPILYAALTAGARAIQQREAAE